MQKDILPKRQKGNSWVPEAFPNDIRVGEVAQKQQNEVDPSSSLDGIAVESVEQGAGEPDSRMGSHVGVLVQVFPEGDGTLERGMTKVLREHRRSL